MKSVYTGDEKVAEFESYDELRVGENKPAFIYEGSELVYPNPVKDGLVLWYDFSGRTNTDGQRGIAEDLSGNGNHGTLQNFNYTTESGYEKNKLLFDGVDDRVIEISPTVNAVYTYESTFLISSKQSDWGGVFGNYNHKSGDRAGGNISAFKDATSSSVRVAYATSSGEYRFVSTVVDVEQVNHVTAVFGEGYERVYINGEIRNENNNGYTPIPSTDGFGLSLGVWESVPSYTFDGDAFSVRAYNRPLTPEEIAHNYAIEKERFGIE